jgi:uncharacterized membrane protein
MAGLSCSNCEKQNPQGSHFCIHCGTPLTLRNDEPSGEDSFQYTQRLQSEVYLLREDIVRINDRLIVLERSQGSAPARQTVPSSVARGTDQPQVDKLDTRTNRDWEQIFGGNWLVRLGVLALVVGMAFSFQFAIANGWIGPVGRVLVGIFVGLLMLSLGEFWRERYSAYARALSGGGIAFLYLSIFAAFNLFNLIDLYPAIAFLLLISLVSGALALRYEAMSLAIIGIIGAFAAPFILNAFVSDLAEIQGRNTQSIRLIAYIWVIALSVVLLSTFRNWRWFTLLGLIGSIGAFFLWYITMDPSTLFAQISLTVIFLIFVGATTLFHMIWRQIPQGFDQSLIALNGNIYFFISWVNLYQDYQAWIGAFSLILAFFYVGLAYIALRRTPDNKLLSLVALGIALVFFTLAIPIQLGNSYWLIFAWVAESTVLVWLSFRTGFYRLRIAALIIFAPVLVLFLEVDSTDLEAFTAVMNARFLAFAFSVLALYFVAYLIRQNWDALEAWEQKTPSAYTLCIVLASFVSIWALTGEAISYFDSQIENLEQIERDGTKGRALSNALNLSITIVWLVYAIASIAGGIIRRSRTVRLVGLALLAVAITKVFVFDVFALETIYRIVAFVCLGCMLLVGGYLYQRYSTFIREFLTE